jgi:hypothetical protein
MTHRIEFVAAKSARWGALLLAAFLCACSSKNQDVSVVGPEPQVSTSASGPLKAAEPSPSTRTGPSATKRLARGRAPAFGRRATAPCARPSIRRASCRKALAANVSLSSRLAAISMRDRPDSSRSRRSLSRETPERAEQSVLQDEQDDQRAKNSARNKGNDPPRARSARKSWLIHAAELLTLPIVP